MRQLSLVSRPACPRHGWRRLSSFALGIPSHYRTALTLAIETSCDDTSVAVLERHEHKPPSSGYTATLHFHEKITANTDAYHGIHPIVALESHQSSLAPLIQRAVEHLPKFSPLDSVPSVSNLLPGSHDGELRRKPDFISVTRGPGMRSNLSVGLDTAKGLSVAWRIPMLGVHHMQAHALTPRLVSALSAGLSSRSPGLKPAIGPGPPAVNPAFPFLSLLVSGGHTLLISSTSVISHSILATTTDIALGDCIDKAARIILPASTLFTPYGRALETFAFPSGSSDYAQSYIPPVNRGAELARLRSQKWHWSFGPPMAGSKGGRSSNRMSYSFAGLLTAVQRFMRYEVDAETGIPTTHERVDEEISEDERRDMAREVMRIAFEHLASRVLLHLKNLETEEQRKEIKTLVVAGGVAANGFLRHVLRRMLDARGFEDVQIVCPPIELCTDNAAMIGWAGCEMWDLGWRSELGFRPIRKWSLDEEAEDGGILGVGGWVKRS